MSSNGVPSGTPGFLQSVFAEVPATYELVNHVLTLGLDKQWRKRAASIAAGAKSGRWADMCTGTAEMATHLSRKAPRGTSILALDFSLPMLDHATAKSDTNDLNFVASDVRALPFPDECLDLITMSFATRNVNLSRDILIQTFSEYYRVLKSGASLVNLETSRPASSLIRKCFDLYVKLCVKLVGGRISGSKTAYAYLAKTIPRFYPAEELANIMRLAGFGEVTVHRYLFGVVAVHEAKKP